MTRLLPWSLARTGLNPAALIGLLITLLTACGDSSASDPEIAMNLPETVGEWVLADAPRTYDRETIFDYINGAGEVYRSYAFKYVLVGLYQKDGGGALNVEIFDMGTPEDAYGVFSYAREEERAGIGAAFESRGSVLCFWQDRFYVCVVEEPGTDAPDSALEDMARGLSRGLPPGGERPALMDALPEEGLVPNSQRFFHTHQSLNYHYYLVRENVLNLGTETDAVLARYEAGPSTLLLVEYPNASEAGKALASFRDQITGGAEAAEPRSGLFVASSQEDSYLIVVLESASGVASETLLNSAVTRLQELQR